MPSLVAVTGSSGAGKTTAIEYLERQGFGQRIYLGEAVFDEIRARGLPRSAQSERSVRLVLRENEGPAVFAVRAMPIIEQTLAAGRSVFIDAIFDLEEYKYLRTSFSNCPSTLLGIVASFETRLLRVASRSDRPLTAEELKGRDSTELSRLGSSNIMERADFKITNEDTLYDFQKRLIEFWSTVIRE